MKGYKLLCEHHHYNYIQIKVKNIDATNTHINHIQPIKYSIYYYVLIFFELFAHDHLIII